MQDLSLIQLVQGMEVGLTSHMSGNRADFSALDLLGFSENIYGPPQEVDLCLSWQTASVFRDAGCQSSHTDSDRLVVD